MPGIFGSIINRSVPKRGNHEKTLSSSEKARSKIHCDTSGDALLSHCTSKHVHLKAEVEVLAKAEHHFTKAEIIQGASKMGLFCNKREKSGFGVLVVAVAIVLSSGSVSASYVANFRSRMNAIPSDKRN